MEKLLNNITKIVVYLIMALGVIFTFWTISKGDDLNLTENAEETNMILNPYFWLSMITFIIAAAAAILFPIGQMASKPKSLIRAGISIAVLAVVYGISWGLASDDISQDFYAKFEITASTARIIGSLIYVVYILGAISILAIIVSGVIGAISKR